MTTTQTTALEAFAAGYASGNEAITTLVSLLGVPAVRDIARTAIIRVEHADNYGDEAHGQSQAWADWQAKNRRAR